MLSKETKSKLTACRRKFKNEKYSNVARIKISVKDVRNTMKTNKSKDVNKRIKSNRYKSKTKSDKESHLKRRD
jgi:hypothetical protein